MKAPLKIGVLAALCLPTALLRATETINFNDLDPGEVVGTITLPGMGTVIIKGIRPGLGDPPATNFAITFPSNAPPPGVDLDLGSPNQTCGGPGISNDVPGNPDSGEVGGAHPNCPPPNGPLDPMDPNIPLNNVLIVADNLTDADVNGLVDVPNDHAGDSNLIFKFMDKAVRFTSIALLDIQAPLSESATVFLYEDLDCTNLIAEIELEKTGDNGLIVSKFDPFDPARCMIVDINGSGAIDNITVNSCGDGSIDDGEDCDDGNNVSGDGCNADCQDESCGDGIEQPDLDEECDDGNNVNGDGCNADCQDESCGDGIEQPDLDEECDDGNNVNGDGCNADCQDEFCGDGIEQPDLDEECDDGNNVNGDGCNADCQDEYCGDGVEQPDLDEECDDGNNNDGDGCNSDCQDESCGDGVEQPGEECDDGNNNDGDGCNSGCQDEYCGDGVEQPGEECDDGNNNDGDGCNSDCEDEFCGDGVEQPGEECDDGNNNDGDGCNSDCQDEYCGDGVEQPGEECDDGNTVDGDGCNSDCQDEDCGDGVEQPGEECDDGNTADGDGCNSDCQDEDCGDGVKQPGEQCDGTDGACPDGGMCQDDCTCPPVCTPDVDCDFECVNTCNGEGCTPGYWKQEHHYCNWSGPYNPGDPFADHFENAFPGMTLVQVLGQGGGGLNALGRHTVAALLNGGSSEVCYDLGANDVIEQFNAVYPGGNYESLKNKFASYNEQGCPLGNCREASRSAAWRVGHSNEGDDDDDDEDHGDGEKKLKLTFEDGNDCGRVEGRIEACGTSVPVESGQLVEITCCDEGDRQPYTGGGHSGDDDDDDGDDDDDDDGDRCGECTVKVEGDVVVIKNADSAVLIVTGGDDDCKIDLCGAAGGCSGGGDSGDDDDDDDDDDDQECGRRGHSRPGGRHGFSHRR